MVTPNFTKKFGSLGFAVVLGVRAAAPTPKTTEIPNEPKIRHYDFAALQ
jgi:hypothetical protein